VRVFTQLLLRGWATLSRGTNRQRLNFVPLYKGGETVTKLIGLKLFVSNKLYGDMSLINHKELGFGINDSYVKRFLRLAKSYPRFYWSAIKNRLRFLKYYRIRTERIFWPTLGLSDKIIVIKGFNARYFEGNGLFWKSSALCDAVITDLIDFPIAFLVADCPVVILFDHAKKILAMVHSGRDGTFKNISGQTVRKMKNSFGSHPNDIIVQYSPHLCSDCHQLAWLPFDWNQSEKYELILSAITVKNRAFHFDLKLAIQLQLQEEGVQDFLSFDEKCTLCGEGDYFSHRGWEKIHPNHPKPGRFAVMAMMTKI